MAENGKKPLDTELLKLVAAILFAAGAFGFVYWKYLWSPFSKRIEDARDKTAKISAEIAKAKAVAGRLDQLNAEIERLRKEADAAENRLPKGKNIPDLIKTLVRQASSCRVKILSITPQSSVDKQYYTEVNYQVSVTGKYHAIGSFLSTLATSQRIFTFQNLSLAGGGKEASASFTLIVYQYKG